MKPPIWQSVWGISLRETPVVLRSCPTPGHLLGASSGQCVLLCMSMVAEYVSWALQLGCISPSLQDQCPMCVSLGLSGAFFSLWKLPRLNHGNQRWKPPTHTYPVAQLSSTTVACGLHSPPAISLSIFPPLEAKETSPPRWVEECEGVEQE